MRRAAAAAAAAVAAVAVWAGAAHAAQSGHAAPPASQPAPPVTYPRPTIPPDNSARPPAVDPQVEQLLADGAAHQVVVVARAGHTVDEVTWRPADFSAGYQAHTATMTITARDLPRLAEQTSLASVSVNVAYHLD